MPPRVFVRSSCLNRVLSFVNGPGFDASEWCDSCETFVPSRINARAGMAAATGGGVDSGTE